MITNVSQYTIEELAEQAVTKPDDFGYWGSDDMFKTWGFTGIDQNRDSDVLERCNFEVITKELIELYPNDFRIETYNHWLCGYVDRLVCRVLEVSNDFDEFNITWAFKAVIEWHERLNNYPIANDYIYDDMRIKEVIESFEELPDYLINMINTEEEYWAADLYNQLSENFGYDIYLDTLIKDDDIKLAIYQRKLWNEDEINQWNEWAFNNNLEPIPLTKVHPDQLKLFED